MPYRNQYMPTGSTYPTGQAPMAFDLSQQMAAITQQMVETRQQEIKEKKLKISESENAILSALDFKTLEGAGDQFALEQAERLNGLTDKWTRKWRDAGGILGTKDKLELLKDKRDIEQKLAVGSAEIAEFNEIQKILKTPNQQVYEYEPTANAVTEYIKSGKLGTGGLINLPVLKKQPFGAKFESMFDPFVAQRAKTFTDDAEVIDRSTGQVSFKKSNKASVDTGIEYLKSTPEYQEMYATNPAQAESVLSRMRLKYLSEPEEEKFVSAVKPRTGGGGGGVITSVDFPDLKGKPAITAAINYNDFAEKLYNLDESAIQQLKGNTYQSVEILPDKIVLTKKDKEGTKDVLPRNTGKLAFKESLWNIAPDNITQGLTNYPVSSFVREEWGLKQPIKAADIDAVRNVKIGIDNYKNPNPQEGTTATGDQVVKFINDLIPNSATYKKAIRDKNRKITFKTTDYFIEKPEERDRLKADVLAEYNKTAAPESGTKPTTVPSMFQ